MKLICLDYFALRSRHVTGIPRSRTPRLSLLKLVRKKRKLHDVPELWWMRISVIFYCTPTICRTPRDNICNAGTEVSFLISTCGILITFILVDRFRISIKRKGITRKFNLSLIVIFYNFQIHNNIPVIQIKILMLGLTRLQKETGLFHKHSKGK
jgi:hypothetical protein